MSPGEDNSSHKMLSFPDVTDYNIRQSDTNNYIFENLTTFSVEQIENWIFKMFRLILKHI